MISQSTVLN